LSTAFSSLKMKGSNFRYLLKFEPFLFVPFIFMLNHIGLQVQNQQRINKSIVNCPTCPETSDCPLSIIHCQLSIVNYPLSIIHCQLSIVNYPLSIIHCQLSIVNCPLSIIHCQLSIVNCPLSIKKTIPLPSSRLVRILHLFYQNTTSKQTHRFLHLLRPFLIIAKFVFESHLSSEHLQFQLLHPLTF
jgi:hypothetical protein